MSEERGEEQMEFEIVKDVEEAQVNQHVKPGSKFIEKQRINQANNEELVDREKEYRHLLIDAGVDYIV